MRDLAIIAIYLPLLGWTLARPFIGVVLWYAVSIGNFHKLAYGFAATLPWAYIVMSVTVLSLLFAKANTKFVWNKPNAMLILWGLWIQVTSVMALNWPQGEPLWEKFMKIWLSTLFLSMFLTTRLRILAMIGVLAGSIGFYGVKGAVHFLVSGTLNVSGPPDSSLSDNNDFGMGCVMMLPLLWYLRSITPKPWQRHAMTAVTLLTLVATLVTQSRGAFLGLSVVTVVFWWKARGKIRILIGAAAIGAVLYSVLPQVFFDRMNSIQTYQSDQSAENRLYNWQHAIKVAAARPLLGGGFGTFRPIIFQMMGEEVPKAVEAHSIFFQTLGDHGYTGLVLFVAMWILTYTTARWIRKRTRGDPSLKWAYDLSFYLQISLVSYVACGTFLSQAYLDLYYALVITVGMTRYVVEKSLAPSIVGASAGRSDQAPVATPAPILGTALQREI